MKQLKTIFAIIKYASPFSYGLIALVFFLGIWYGIDDDHSNAFWEWIDPVAGIMTFFTTLIIFGFQARKNWVDSLEKMLTVEYIYTGEDTEIIIAKIENAYLSGESDVRQWAQSLGQQIMGNLDFDMNWDELPWKINYRQNENKYIKYYEVKLYLTSDPRLIYHDERKGLKVIEAFLQRKFKYSIVVGNIKQLPIKWIRK